MITQSGEVLRKLRAVLNLKDMDAQERKAAINRILTEYGNLGGKNQGLRTSLRNMHPLHSLNKYEQQRFLEWLSPEDRKFLNKADKYYNTFIGRLF